MEPILEEMGLRRRTSGIDDEALDQINFKPDPKRELAFKSGFVSLQERLTNWHKQRHKPADDKSRGGQPSRRQQTGPRQQHQPQFANLYEFFQSKSSLRKQLELEEKSRSQRKPRVPIMRLSKEDWNVRCWEERLRAYRRRGEPTTTATSKSDRGGDDERDKREQQRHKNRAQRLELQVEVFNGRIDEVAKKLERVREGTPQDEELYKLEKNRLREPRREHTWTDQLKAELSQGLHDRKVLKSQILERQSKRGPMLEQPRSGANNNNDNKRPVVLSPIGRPIGRILDDDDD